MPSTISNFLVGLGFSYDDKGIKQFNSGMESMKSKALQVGAIVGGAFGFKKLTVDAARNADQLSRLGDIYGVTASQVNALNQAMISVKGSAADSIENITTLSKIISETPQAKATLIGQLGIQFGDFGANAAKVVTSAKNVKEALRDIIIEGGKLPRGQQRRFVEAFGLTPSTVLQVQKGIDVFDESVKKFQDLRPGLDKVTEVAREFNQQLQITKQRVSSITDEVTIGLLPPLTKGLSDLNTFLNDHKQGIASGLDFIGNHALALIAAFAGFKVLGLGKLLSIGSRAAGASRILSGGATAAVVGGFMMQEATASPIPENVQLFGDSSTSQQIFDIKTPQKRAMRPIDLSRVKVQPEPALPSTGFGFGYQPLPPVTVNLTLDGKVIDKRFIDLNHQQNHQTLNQIKSPVRG